MTTRIHHRWNALASIKLLIICLNFNLKYSAESFECPSIKTRILFPRKTTLFKSSTATSNKRNFKQDKIIRHPQALLKKAIAIYSSYTSRLWNETSAEARNAIAADKATGAIKTVQHILESEEMIMNDNNQRYSLEAIEAKYQLLEGCYRMLNVLEGEKGFANDGKNSNSFSPLDTEDQKIIQEKIEKAENINYVLEAENVKEISKPKKKKSRRSILFGATMGFVVACWVFSGNYIFTALFTLMTIVGQLEYYRMVMNVGIYPARRISVTGACAMFITALFAPNLHQIILPVFATVAMIWFLTMRRQVSSIAEIATTFTGMFYLGYIPSFWVRTRLIGAGREPTRLAPIAGPILSFLGGKIPDWFPKDSVIRLPITTGAVFIFWSWLCIAFSDVGGYFAGRQFGKTKLASISPAAGKTSPNKTIEGVLGGCIVSAGLASLGAWIQKWPYWFITGPVHGVMLALLGLIGDLTASMLKRDAGLKDFGDLIPEHGGIMDRVDSFIFTAPYSWLVCNYIIPSLKVFARGA